MVEDDEKRRKRTLASKFQLYRLNQAGRLALVDAATPLMYEQVWGEVARSLEKLGIAGDSTSPGAEPR